MNIGESFRNFGPLRMTVWQYVSHVSVCMVGRVVAGCGPSGWRYPCGERSSEPGSRGAWLAASLQPTATASQQQAVSRCAATGVGGWKTAASRITSRRVRVLGGRGAGSQAPRAARLVCGGGLYSCLPRGCALGVQEGRISVIINSTPGSAS